MINITQIFFQSVYSLKMLQTIVMWLHWKSQELHFLNWVFGKLEMKYAGLDNEPSVKSIVKYEGGVPKGCLFGERTYRCFKNWSLMSS